jgi:hypothetical protein
MWSIRTPYAVSATREPSRRPIPAWLQTLTIEEP